MTRLCIQPAPTCTAVQVLSSTTAVSLPAVSRPLRRIAVTQIPCRVPDAPFVSHRLRPSRLGGSSPGKEDEAGGGSGTAQWLAASSMERGGDRCDCVTVVSCVPRRPTTRGIGRLVVMLKQTARALVRVNSDTQACAQCVVHSVASNATAIARSRDELLDIKPRPRLHSMKTVKPVNGTDCACSQPEGTRILQCPAHPTDL